MKILILLLAALSLSPRQRRELSHALDGGEADDDLISDPGAGGHASPVFADASGANPASRPGPAPDASPDGAGPEGVKGMDSAT